MASAEARTPSGFVLVGGRSSRLGTDKAGFDLGGRLAADRMGLLVAEICGDDVLLVGRGSLSGSTFEVVPDRSPDRGPLGGVLTCLESSRRQFALIVATDLWGLSVASLRSVAGGLVGEGRSATQWDVAYAVPGSGAGGPQPLCAVWNVETCLPLVRSHVESGRLSVQGILESLSSRPVSVPDEELVNINLPQDLENYLRETPSDR